MHATDIQRIRHRPVLDGERTGPMSTHSKYDHLVGADLDTRRHAGNRGVERHILQYRRFHRALGRDLA